MIAEQPFPLGPLLFTVTPPMVSEPIASGTPLVARSSVAVPLPMLLLTTRFLLAGMAPATVGCRMPPTTCVGPW